MRRCFLVIVILLTAVLGMAGARKPEVSIRQLLRLDHGDSYEAVFRRANMQCQSPTGMPYPCLYGRHVEWESVLASARITAPDAVGVFLCDVGSGSWEVVTDHTEWLDAYLKEARRLGFFSADEQYEVPTGRQSVVWHDETDPDTGRLVRRTAHLCQLKKGVFTNRVIDITLTGERLLLSMGWEF